jgi:hypothetical protein
VEILVATALTLMMMGMVVTIFALVTDSISGSSAALEVADRLRAVKDTLQSDLDGITATLAPPRDPKNDEGYFEYIEGPIGPVISTEYVAVSDSGYDYDTDGEIDPDSIGDGAADPDVTGLIGDPDDVLMFTTRTRGTPFTGRWLGSSTGSAQSQTAEVCWFIRGTTLYRRVLLVLPSRTADLPPNTDPSFKGFYANYDVSVRQEGGTTFDRFGQPSSGATPLRLVANSLGDLTKRENRYGHQPYAFPHDARFWGPLGLPTIRECSSYSQASSGGTIEWRWPFPTRSDTNTDWPQYQILAPTAIISGPPADSVSLVVPEFLPFSVDPGTQTATILTPSSLVDRFDPIRRPYPWLNTSGTNACDPVTGGLIEYVLDPDGIPTTYPTIGSTRLIDDVVMTNVLSFDVQVWDPNAPIFQQTDGAGNLLTDAAGNPVTVQPGDRNYLRLTKTATPALDSTSALGAYHVSYSSGSPNPITRPIGYGAYVDLNYMCLLDLNAVSEPDYPPGAETQPMPYFHGPGHQRSGVRGHAPDMDFLPFRNFDPSAGGTAAQVLASVYDSWSTHYEADGLDQDGADGADQGTNGFDDNNRNGVDEEGEKYDVNGDGTLDFGEKEAPPPYPYPLRGLRVKIRAYEPNSRQVREVTVVQQFTDR